MISRLCQPKRTVGMGASIRRRCLIADWVADAYGQVSPALALLMHNMVIKELGFCRQTESGRSIMKTRVRRLQSLPVIALFALLLTGGNVSAAGFSSLYTFGDSLSDVGSSSSAEMSLYKRLADNCFFSCPPYFEGRVSNGIVATEYLADSLVPGGRMGANFHSYAFAGATSGVGNSGDGGTATQPGNLLPDQIPFPLIIPGILPLPGMKQEMEQYMKDSGGQADPNALYFVWGGANDYLSHENLTTLGAAQLAAQNIGGYVSELAAAGARHILVPNLADLGRTPFARVEGEEAEGRAFSLSFNETLAGQLDDVSARFPTADIFQFDTYSFLNGVIENPLEYKFTDVQNSCLALDCGDAGNAGSFLYWDEFHPTTYAHSVIASAFASAVPEPEIFAMLIGGLFVLGIASSRQRKVEYARGKI